MPSTPNPSPFLSLVIAGDDLPLTGALHWMGERHTAGDVIAEVKRDVPFYDEGGGLTLTGGEATMQPDMAEALLWLAKAEGISSVDRRRSYRCRRSICQIWPICKYWWLIHLI